MKPSLHKLQKILKLEAERGYDNHAVLGGFERFMDHWEAEARLDGLAEDLIQVKTKAHGISRDAANKTKCDFVIVKLTAQEVAGTLSCKGMTDMSAANAAPDVTDVKFDGRLKTK